MNPDIRAALKTIVNCNESSETKELQQFWATALFDMILCTRKETISRVPRLKTAVMNKLVELMKDDSFSEKAKCYYEILFPESKCSIQVSPHVSNDFDHEFADKSERLVGAPLWKRCAQFLYKYRDNRTLRRITSWLVIPLQMEEYLSHEDWEFPPRTKVHTKKLKTTQDAEFHHRNKLSGYSARVALRGLWKSKLNDMMEKWNSYM